MLRHMKPPPSIATPNWRARLNARGENRSQTKPAHTRRNNERKTMNTKHALQIQWIQRRAWLPALVGLALGAASALAEPADNRAPEVPAQISVGDTNKVHF